MKKSKKSVRESCMEAFDQMPEIFSPLRFCAAVRVITGRSNLMDGTTLRRLREIRADHIEFNYRYTDPKKCLYQKVKYKQA